MFSYLITGPVLSARYAGEWSKAWGMCGGFKGGDSDMACTRAHGTISVGTFPRSHPRGLVFKPEA